MSNEPKVPQEPQAQERCSATAGHPDVRCQLMDGHSGQHICGDMRSGGYTWPAPSRISAEALERRIARIASRACTGQQGESQIEYEIEELLKDALSTAPAPAQGETLADFAKRREAYHMTFSGGWHHSEDGLRAFHHGMDTVFNGLDAAVKGERDQSGHAWLPAPPSAPTPQEKP